MKSWRDVQRRNFTSWEVLADFLNLDIAQRQKLIKKHSFSLNLPWRLAEKIQKKTLDDPILKQFVPLLSETTPFGFEKDPVKDKSFCLSEKLLQKYEGRALILSTSACAMHCRYCFRQHFPYEVERKNFEKELELLRNNTSLKEVILSGGDPLSLSNETLQSLLGQLDTIAHLNRVRFHTRFPLGIPERIDNGLLTLLDNCRLQTWFVIHSNHPLELDEEVLNALKKIQQLGIPILNQSVLLKGVNDSTDILCSLFLKMVDHGISPYYLHQMDRVEGGQDFEVSEEKGLQLMNELRALLPGYAIPSYVREVAGETHKTVLGP